MDIESDDDESVQRDESKL